jgi:enterochelin esterase-like enzyme
MDPEAALAHFSAISLQASTAFSASLTFRHIPAHRVVGEAMPDFISRLKSEPSYKRDRAIGKFVQRASRYGQALVEDSTVYFFYVGRARRVTVPGELNGWDPEADIMARVRGTQFHYLAREVPRNARIEYKLAVDSTWILDPYNQRIGFGGSGPNSEVAMPGYTAPKTATPSHDVSHGRIEAMECASRFLRRAHPVFVYLPPGYGRSGRRDPSLYILDGGDYFSLGMMATVLDNMIAARRIQPVVAVFVEPRTNVARADTNKRTTDYTMNDLFVDFLAREVRPTIEERYRVSTSARKRGIMGASLGGLLATYAAYTRPHIFSLCAAQSPSYWWKKGALNSMIARGPLKPIRFYIDTGTMDDSLDTTRAMRDVLRRKQYRFAYAEHPEGHNWGNWRAHIPDILEYFWGLR